MEEKTVYERLAEKTVHQAFGSGSPYRVRILKKLVTPEEAEMLLKMPVPSEELAGKWSMDEEAASAKVEDFIARGLVTPRRGIFECHLSLEITLSSNPKYVDKELQDLWKEAWDAEEREHFGLHYGEGATAHHVRIVPNRLALQKSPPPPGGVLPEEDIETIYRKARRIANIPCPCRLCQQNCDRPLHCFQLDTSADLVIGRGAGREISVEEALEASDECERAGMLHMLTTHRLRQMCHCCGDCCIIVDAGVAYGTMERGLVKSRYQATVDLDLCTGCQDCVENCPCSAIEMLKAPGSKRLKSFVDPEKCWGCGPCVVGCPEGALTLKLVRPDTSSLYSEGLR